jgi:uncharacterized protein involved in exopolysaccharide biosynthesis
LNKEQPITNIEKQTSNANSSANQPSPENRITPLDLLFILAKRWKMIVGVPFVAAVIAAIITLFIPNIYTAKSMIVPSDNNSGGMGAALMAQLGGLAAMAGGAVSAKTTGDLYLTMLKSETLKDPIIDKFKLIEHYDAKFRSDVYLKLNEVANVILGKKDGVITISVSDKDPRIAADLANEYVNQLSKLISRLNMDDAGEYRIFLEQRIAGAREDLTKSEDSLKAFQSKNKTISVPDQIKATIEGVAQLRAQLAVQEVQLGTLKRQFTDNSQEVKTAKSTIANLRAQIASLEGKGRGSSSIPNLGSVPQLGQEYLRLMREFKIQEAVLEMLTKQYEGAKLTESKDTTPFQLLEKAKVPERKSEPRRGQIVIITALAAGFLMVFLAFVREFGERMNDNDRKRWQELQTLLPLLRRFSKMQQ